MSDKTTKDSGGLNRADFLKRSGAAVGGVVLGGAAAQPAWASRGHVAGAHAAASTITIGYVSPLTGADSGFGEPDPYVISLAKKAFGKGLKIGGTTYSVDIVAKDAQSVPSTSAMVAQELINSNVDPQVGLPLQLRRAGLRGFLPQSLEGGSQQQEGRRDVAE
jgi:ABC-type branched-subunit amino acid transport system substrate-binding protein